MSRRARPGGDSTWREAVLDHLPPAISLGLERVAYRVRDKVLVVALARPPVNAIDHPMIDAIHAALRAAEADTVVRAVILTSDLPGMFRGDDEYPICHDEADDRRDQWPRPWRGHDLGDYQ
jgi:enoyl-CoA hydratase/carnithine racemase